MHTTPALLLDEHGHPYRRRDGRPVHLIQGGAEDGQPSGANPDAGNAAGQAPPPAATTPAVPVVPAVVPPGATVAGTPGAAPAPTGGQLTAEQVGQLPDWAQREIREARNQAANARVNNQQTQQTLQEQVAAAVQAAQADWSKNIGKALGLVKDEGSALTPEQAAEQFAAKESDYRTKIRDLTIDNALGSALAGTQPGARDALVGSGKLRDLDPDAADFTDQLNQRVTEYLTAHPYFKTAPTPPPLTGTNGGDFTGSTVAPPGGEKTIDELRAERAKRRAG